MSTHPFPVPIKGAVLHEGANLKDPSSCSVAEANVPGRYASVKQSITPYTMSRFRINFFVGHECVGGGLCTEQ